MLHHTTAISPLAAAVLLAFAPLCANAQRPGEPSLRLAPALAAPSGGGASASGANDQAAPPAAAPGDNDPLQEFAAPLMREGTSLVEARARMQRDADQNWTLVVEPSPAAVASDPHTAPYQMILLPCTRLNEMERIIEATPGGNVRFAVTGRVFVFRDRNYLLATHAAVITAPAAGEPRAAAPPATSAALSASASPQPRPAPSAGTSPANPSSPPAAPSSAAASPPTTRANPDDDSAEAIARALEQQTGPIVRSSGIALSPQSQAPAQATGNPPTPPRAGMTNNNGGGNTNSATAGAAPRAEVSSRGAGAATLQENTALVNRRGKITRDRSGGWLLVFDADAAGLADPPMRLLPCMLLQSIEDYARRTGNNSPIIVSGQVFLYDSQNYLLPTVYRIPHERSRITP